jgi:DNA-binding PadR family transcriptional regulator
MATETTSFRHFILGLLERRPMSGYDIKSLFGHLNWLIGNSSFGSIYSTLHALLEDDLVSVRVVQNPDKPSKKVYSINEKGRRTLQQWIERPVTPKDSLRSFAMHLLLASSLTGDRLTAHLRQRHVQVASHRTTLEQVLGKPGETDAGKRLVCEYGLAMANAELDWLDSALGQLRKEPIPEEDIETVRV